MMAFNLWSRKFVEIENLQPTFAVRMRFSAKKEAFENFYIVCGALIHSTGLSLVSLESSQSNSVPLVSEFSPQLEQFRPGDRNCIRQTCFYDGGILSLKFEDKTESDKNEFKPLLS